VPQEPAEACVRLLALQATRLPALAAWLRVAAEHVFI
jgi:hypothetical protein